ncbi:hypothetical protein LEN26_013216, partial [Aphanomyces euteiches]
MDPRRQEDLNLGPDHADAFIAGSERDPPHTNTMTESAIVTYTESPLTTLRKRDLEYRRLHHANSPEQRDPEKRSRQLPAEYSDEDMGSDTKSDLAPSPALDASEAGPSDHSSSELSFEPRSSLEELPSWESYDDSSFPAQDLIHYDGDPVSTINVPFDDAFTPEDGRIVPFSHSAATLTPTSSAITRTVTTVVSRTISETTNARTMPQLLQLPEHDELGLVVTGHGNHANHHSTQRPALTLDTSPTSLRAHQSQLQIESLEVPALEYALADGPSSCEDYQLTPRGDLFGTHDHPQVVHRDPRLLGPSDPSNVISAVPDRMVTTSEHIESRLELTDVPHVDPSATDMEISEIDHGLALLPTVSDLSQRVLDLQDSVRYTETSVSLQLNQMLVDQHGVNSALGSLTSAVEVASNRTQLLEVDLSSLEQGVSSTRQDLLNRVQQLTDQVHQVGLTVETTRSVTDSQISYIQKSLTETVPRETHETAIQTLTETILELRQSLQDQASVCQQLRSGLLCNEDRFQTELHQLQQEVQSLRLLQSDFQTRVPAEFSETRHLVEELDKSNKHLSACVSDLTRENSQLTKQVLFLKEQLNRHQQELQELRTQTPETQQATEPTSVPTSSDSNEVPALVRDLNERIASLAAGLTSNMNDLKESIIVMDQDKKLGQATKFTIVPSSDHQDDCAFFIRQLLETADRCQLSDNDRRSLLGLKLCSDKTPPSLRKWWISFAKTKQGETWSDVLAEFQDQFCLRTSRQKVTDLLNDSVRYEDETVRSYATRLQSIIDEVGFPADQGVNLFKLGVRHLKTESCLENTDRELKTIADCVKLLRAREVPLDDAPMPASRPKSRAGSASDTASTYTSQSEASSDRTPPRSPRHNRRGSRVSFDEPSTVERLLATLLDQQKEFVAHIERSDRHHQSLMDALMRPMGPHFVAPIRPSTAPQYGQSYGYPYTPFAPQSAVPPAPLM